MNNSQHIRLVETETKALLGWAAAITESKASYFQSDQQLARRLGAHYQGNGLTQVGFWTPALTSKVIQTQRKIYLEVFTPVSKIDCLASEQVVTFRRDCVELPQQGEYIWGVISGMLPGTRSQLGSFYWLRYHDTLHKVTEIIHDVLAYSTPYGVFAPAELYDVKGLQRQREDLEYLQHSSKRSALNPIFEDVNAILPRVDAPINILQIHVKTASPEGTLEGLTQIFRQLSEKLANNEPLTPAEENYLGYDAVQLLPTEPTIEYRLEDRHREYEFFAGADLEEKWNLEEEWKDEDFLASQPIEITLRKPNTQNWGYDVPVVGAASTNPSLLGSLRPDEVIDFIATLHNFSQGPIQVIYDVVYGHADNQALELIGPEYFKGPNMYGQDLNHQLPMVRAILLEMQRRKINTGVDGIRIDGGQDFRFFNPLSGQVEHDDTYLLAMSDVVQEINGYKRLLFTIFEDGRPWPEEGWEETSTYRDLIELRPDSYQWGPLIFAHNTPTLKGFWAKKWQRVREVMFQGDRWITGCGNHDTVRRGNQIDPTDSPINWNLGETLPVVLRKAYDNPATQMWVYGFCPGLPMDFLNAMMHSPWGFFRNTDERYGVKVTSEEAGFLDWQISPQLFQNPVLFVRLKELGFNDLKQLREFMKTLAEAMDQTDYDLEETAEACQSFLGSKSKQKGKSSATKISARKSTLANFLADLNVPKLKAFALAFMEDGHEACRVSHYFSSINPQQSAFNLMLRQYRRANPWLRENLTGSDRFNRIEDPHSTVFYGLRTAPVTEDVPAEETINHQVVLVAHMGGDPVMVTLGDWLQLNLSEWQVAIATPGLDIKSDPEALRAFELQDGQGLLLESMVPGH